MDNILRVCGLEMTLDTTKVHKAIIVMPCCAGKSRQPNSIRSFCYVQNKLHFSNWENHNRKLESVCLRYKMSENHTWYTHLLQFFTKWPLESRFSNFKVVLNSTATTDSLIYFTQCTLLSTFIKSTAFHCSYFCYLDDPAQSLPVQKAH